MSTARAQWVVFLGCLSLTAIVSARLVSPGVRHQGPLDEGWYLTPFEISFTVP